MLTERKIKADKSNPEHFTRRETDYTVRSRETLTFTAYRVGSEWLEPADKRGKRKEEEYKRKGYACVTVATEHTNAVTVACDEHCRRKRVTLVTVRVTGEPDAVREYLDAIGMLSRVQPIENGLMWEIML